MVLCRMNIFQQCIASYCYYIVAPSTTYAVCYDKSFGLFLGRSKATWTTQQSQVWVSNY